jgi:hypothetical protein
MGRVVGKQPSKPSKPSTLSIQPFAHSQMAGDGVVCGGVVQTAALDYKPAARTSRGCPRPADRPASRLHLGHRPCNAYKYDCFNSITCYRTEPC